MDNIDIEKLKIQLNNLNDDFENFQFNVYKKLGNGLDGVSIEKLNAGTITSKAIKLDTNGAGDAYINAGLRNYFETTRFLGASDSQFDITNPSGDTRRVTWDGTGTDPAILSNINVGDTVGLYLLGTSYVSNGEYLVTNVAANYFDFEDALADTGTNYTIGDGKLEVSSPGFILGVDDSDDDTGKFFIGDYAKSITWNGSTFYIKGSLQTADFNWTTLFESLDGFDTGGTGTEVITQTLAGVTLQTDTSTSDTAYVRKYLGDYGTLFTWDKNRVVRIGLDLEQITNQTIYAITGSTLGTAERMGFKIVDDVLYGVIADGTSETTTTLKTLINTNALLLEFRWYAGDRCEFYVNGDFLGMLNDTDDDLPSGDTSAYRFIGAEIKTDEDALKKMTVQFWDFWQEY